MNIKGNNKYRRSIVANGVGVFSMNIKGNNKTLG